MKNVEVIRGSRRIRTDLHRTLCFLGQQPYPPAKTFATAARRLLAAA